MADITCPECGHTATVSVKTVNVEDILQLQRNENMAVLKDISDRTGTPIEVLFAEASEAAESLELAIPILESKYNICWACGNLKQESPTN